HALQDLVAELGVADSGIGIEAGADGILLEHRADTEVLADIAKEVDRRERRGPVEVVDEPCGVVTLEVEEARNLGLEVTHPLRDGVRGVECPLSGRSRVTDETGRSADEPEGLVAGKL